MDLEAFVENPEAFRTHVAERLEHGPIDFVEQMQFVEEKRAAGEKYAASAVLLPLEFDASSQEYGSS